MKKIVLLFLLTPLLGMAQLAAGLQTFSVNGRSYDVTTPSDYNSANTYPIVFELHSFGADRTEMNHISLINEQQYISVRPEGGTVFGVRAWNTWGVTQNAGYPNDVAYVTAVYNDIQTRMGASFDANKVYVYGYSNGGAMAMKLIEETNLFKAAVIRSMSFEQGHNIPSTSSKVPMIFVHGTGDNTVPYQGGQGQYGFLSPTFESVKTTVNKWATFYGINAQPTEIKYLAGSSAISDKDFYFREHFHNAYPIYFFAIQDGTHATNQQFSNANIKRAMLRLIKSPKCYGTARGLEACMSIL